MKCSECPRTIHPERLKAIPQTVTCGPECSNKRSKRRRAESAKKRHKATGYQAAKKYAQRTRPHGPIGRPRKNQPKDSKPLSS